MSLIKINVSLDADNAQEARHKASAGDESLSRYVRNLMRRDLKRRGYLGGFLPADRKRVS